MEDIYMKKSRKDKQQDFIMTLLRPLVYIWMWLDAKRKVYRTDKVNFRRKEPYVLLGNHTYLFDVVHVPLRLRKVPFIIASQTLFTKQPTKFLVTQVAHVIPKSKGKSDMNTIRKVFDSVAKGYPILIFPEGNTTYYGETEYIESSTMKLLKKLGLDVMTCNVKGGFLSRPRWGKGKRGRHHIELYYDITITKDEIKNLSVEEIGKIVNKALYYNAYEDQREKMISHPGKHLAEGLEDVVYVCPHCQAINTIETSGNEITCTSCHAKGHIDKYGFIHGFKFDNLVDWNHFQRQHSEKLRDTRIEAEGFLSFLEVKNETQDPVGRVRIVYDNGEIQITGAADIKIPVSEITNPTMTLRRDFGFEYDGKHYMLKMDSSGAQFLRAVQDKY